MIGILNLIIAAGFLAILYGYLVGKKIKIGEVILKGGRLNFPCKYLADLLKKPLVLPLYNRSGLNCSIEKGGWIKKGDKIIQLED